MAVKPKEKENFKRNILEWVVFFLSLLLILANIAYLIYQSVSVDQKAPPKLSIQIKKDDSINDLNSYKIKVKNYGTKTAEQVRVEVVLYQSGEKKEVAIMELAFVPKKSSREGYISFSGISSPKDSVSTRVVSFELP